MSNNRYLDEESAEKDRLAKTSADLSKEERIKKETARLKRLFTKIDPQKKKLVLATIDDVAFMTVTMQDLRVAINRSGTTITYKNGENQYGEKQSPDAQLYLQMSQRQNAAMKILLDCLPKTQAEPAKKSDGFEDFILSRED